MTVLVGWILALGMVVVVPLGLRLRRRRSLAPVELAVLLTAGMWLLGWIVWRDVARSAAGRTVRALFGVSSVVLAATMLLALSWAAGQVWDAVPHLSLTWMAATHGVANALGFALCGLLAWRRLQRTPAAV